MLGGREDEVTQLPWIALGGALGAVARFGVSLAAARALGPSLPWGTFLVNVLGSICLGALMEASLQAEWSPQLKVLLTTGFLGAFTTFSTFSVETVRLVERGDLGFALGSVLGNGVLGIGGAFLGILAARWWLG